MASERSRRRSDTFKTSKQTMNHMPPVQLINERHLPRVHEPRCSRFSSSAAGNRGSD